MEGDWRSIDSGSVSDSCSDYSAVESALSLVRRRLGTLERVYKGFDKDQEWESVSQQDERWEQDARQTFEYGERKRRLAQASKDIYGEREMEQFLFSFKKQRKQGAASVELQRWWRMCMRRTRFLSIQSRRRKRLANALDSWKLSIQIERLSRKAIQRRYLYEWRILKDQAEETRDLILRMTDEHADKVMTKVLKQIQAFGLKQRLEEEQNKLQKERRGSMVEKKSRETRTCRFSEVEADRDGVLLDRGRRIEELRQKQLIWNAMKTYVKEVNQRRAQASVHLSRMLRLSKRNQTSTKWLGELVELVFRMWYRMTMFKRSMRRGEETPQFQTNIPEWNHWVKLYTRRHALHSKAIALFPRMMQKRYFLRMLEFYQVARRNKELLMMAKNQYERSCLKHVLIAWFKYARQRGKVLREKRKILLAWFRWTQRKRRLRVVKAYLSTNLRSSLKRQLVHIWRDRTEVSRDSRVYQVDKLYCSAMRHAGLALYALFVWKGDDTHACFVRAWNGWKLLWKRRRVWDYVSFSYQRFEARRMQQEHFQAWAAVVQKKKSCRFSKESQKAAVSERVLSNVELGCAAELRQAIEIATRRPPRFWELEDEHDLDTLREWMKRKTASPPIVPRHQTALHKAVERGDVGAVSQLVSHMEPVVKEAKRSEMEEKKRLMDIKMKKDLFGEDAVLPKSDLVQGPLESDERVAARLEELASKYSDHMIDAQDTQGETALHIAARNLGEHYLDIVIWLVQAGASVCAKNDRGKTALDLAIDPKIHAFLKAHVERLESQSFSLTELQMYRRIRTKVTWSCISFAKFLRHVVQLSTGLVFLDGTSSSTSRDLISRLATFTPPVTLPGSAKELQEVHEELAEKRAACLAARMKRDANLITRAAVRENLGKFKTLGANRRKSNVEMEFVDRTKQSSDGNGDDENASLSFPFRGNYPQETQVQFASITPFAFSQRVLLPLDVVAIYLRKQFGIKSNLRTGGKTFKALFQPKLDVQNAKVTLLANVVEHGQAERENAMSLQLKHCQAASGEEQAEVEPVLKNAWAVAATEHRNRMIRLEGELEQLVTKIARSEQTIRHKQREIRHNELRINIVLNDRRATARTVKANQRRTMQNALHIDKSIFEWREKLDKAQERLAATLRDKAEYEKRKLTRSVRYKALLTEEQSHLETISECEREISSLRSAKTSLSEEHNSEMRTRIRGIEELSNEEVTVRDKVRVLQEEVGEEQSVLNNYNLLLRQLEHEWCRLEAFVDEEEFFSLTPFDAYSPPRTTEQYVQAFQDLVQSFTDMAISYLDSEEESGHDSTEQALSESEHHHKEESDGSDVEEANEESEEGEDNEDGEDISEDDTEGSSEHEEEEEEVQAENETLKDEGDGMHIENLGPSGDEVTPADQNESDEPPADSTMVDDELQQREEKGNAEEMQAQLSKTCTSTSLLSTTSSSVLSSWESDDEETFDIFSSGRQRNDGEKHLQARTMTREDVLAFQKNEKNPEEVLKDPFLELAKPLSVSDRAGQKVWEKALKEEKGYEREFRRKTMVAVVRSGSKQINHQESSRRLSTMYDQSRSLLFSGEVVKEEAKVRANTQKLDLEKAEKEEFERMASQLDATDIPFLARSRKSVIDSAAAENAEDDNNKAQNDASTAEQQRQQCPSSSPSQKENEIETKQVVETEVGSEQVAEAKVLAHVTQQPQPNNEDEDEDGERTPALASSSTISLDSLSSTTSSFTLSAKRGRKVDVPQGVYEGKNLSVEEDVNLFDPEFIFANFICRTRDKETTTSLEIEGENDFEDEMYAWTSVQTVLWRSSSESVSVRELTQQNSQIGFKPPAEKADPFLRMARESESRVLATRTMLQEPELDGTAQQKQQPGADDLEFNPTLSLDHEPFPAVLDDEDIENIDKGGVDTNRIEESANRVHDAEMQQEDMQLPRKTCEEEKEVSTEVETFGKAQEEEKSHEERGSEKDGDEEGIELEQSLQIEASVCEPEPPASMLISISPREKESEVDLKKKESGANIKTQAIESKVDLEERFAKSIARCEALLTNREIFSCHTLSVPNLERPSTRERRCKTPASSAERKRLPKDESMSSAQATSATSNENTHIVFLPNERVELPKVRHTKSSRSVRASRGVLNTSTSDLEKRPSTSHDLYAARPLGGSMSVSGTKALESKDPLWNNKILIPPSSNLASGVKEEKGDDDTVIEDILDKQDGFPRKWTSRLRNEAPKTTELVLETKSLLHTSSAFGVEAALARRHTRKREQLQLEPLIAQEKAVSRQQSLQGVVGVRSTSSQDSTTREKKKTRSITVVPQNASKPTHRFRMEQIEPAGTKEIFSDGALEGAALMLPLSRSTSKVIEVSVIGSHEHGTVSVWDHHQSLEEDSSIEGDAYGLLFPNMKTNK